MRSRSRFRRVRGVGFVYVAVRVAGADSVIVSGTLIVRIVGMTKSPTQRVEVRPDHTAVIVVPPDVPIGPVDVTSTFEPVLETTARKLTGAKLANSDFVGMWKDRDDLPTTSEEFSAWRQKIWAR